MTLVGAFFVRLETGGERMSEYKKYFEAYCKEHVLELRLSSEMPVGSETANGTLTSRMRSMQIDLPMNRPRESAEIREN